MRAHCVRSIPSSPTSYAAHCLHCIQVFVPVVKPLGTPVHCLSKQPWYQVFGILRMLIIGWPLYLLFNASGHYYDRSDMYTA
jgi:hypothetical protein